MSVLDALMALTPRCDPLPGLLAALPMNEPEAVPGQEWARLQEALGLDVAPGKTLISTIKSKKMGGTHADLPWERIQRLSQEGHDLYFGLSKVAEDWAPRKYGERGTAETCLPRRFVGVDFDLEFGSHATDGIRLDDTIKAIGRFPVRPVAVVYSGGGLHAYYRLAGAADAPAMAWVGDRLNGYFGRATDVDDWDSKPTVDIARILRIPGTLNHKEEPISTRLLHVDLTAEPVTRALVENWPTLDEVKRRKTPAASRPRRDVPKMVRVHEGTTPWDAFNEAFLDHDAFAAFLERLGADMNGLSARMPGSSDMEPNCAYSANIHSNADDTTTLLTIHGATTCLFWNGGTSRSQFSAYDLLTRVFDGDRSATARYVKRHVLDDVEGWLEGFSWEPGQPAPAVPGGTRTRSTKTARPAVPRSEDVDLEQDFDPDFEPALPVDPEDTPAPRPVKVVVPPAPVTRAPVRNQRPALHLVTPTGPSPSEAPERSLAARGHCTHCCPGTAYAHRGVEHVATAQCAHAAHCAEHCYIPACTAVHATESACTRHDSDW